MPKTNVRPKKITTISVETEIKRKISLLRKGGETWDEFFERIDPILSKQTEK